MSKVGETILVAAVLVAVALYVNQHVTCFDWSPFVFKGCVIR